jgi:hypothetical protein
VCVKDKGQGDAMATVLVMTKKNRRRRRRMWTSMTRRGQKFSKVPYIVTFIVTFTL